MAITYHAGRRIQGTSTDFAGTPAVAGGWVELGRTTNGSELRDISVGSLANKRYYMVLGDMRKGASTHGTGIHMNADTGASYAVRRNGNGGTDNTNINLSTDGGYITDTRVANNFNVTYVANLATKEKLWQNQNVHQSTAGAGTAPTREEGVGKWANTADAMSTFTYHSWGGNYGTGSECVVLGWDPEDTHSTNFWEELASVDLSGLGVVLDSGTIPAKKYLWVQAYYNSTAVPRSTMTFNSDTGSNYADRISVNGATDTTQVSQSGIDTSESNGRTLMNYFIVNNSANEKLVTGHIVNFGAAGAGTAPRREEVVGKWANTSSQITKITFTTNQNMGTNSKLRVWGSD